MSAESGLGTFRDAGGLWEQYEVEDVATPEGFARNPQLVLDFYARRRAELSVVQPCEGHRLVAELERDFDVAVVTQNVDNLHERAGSTHVVHLHGELTKVTSSARPDQAAYIRTLSPDEPYIRLGDKSKDGSQERPFIVWFGEAVPLIETAINLAGQADIFVVIGTSLNVYPAAGMLHYIRAGVPVYLIDPKDVPYSGGGGANPYTHIRKGASEGMKELIALLKKHNS